MRAISLLSTALASLSAGLFVAAGVMLTWEVAARYFFVRPTIWAAELSQLCLIWGSLLAMGWALAARRHIRVSALTDLVGGPARRGLEVAAMVIVGLFSVLVAWKGWAIFWDSFARGRTTGSMLDLPSWVAELAVPVGFALLFLQAVIEGFRALKGDLPVDDKVVQE